MKRLLGILLLVSTVALADDVYYWVEKSRVESQETRVESQETRVESQESRVESQESRVESPQKPKVTYLNSSQDTVRVIIKR